MVKCLIRYKSLYNLSPHCAFYSMESDLKLQEKAINEILRAKEGYRPLNVVN